MFEDKILPVEEMAAYEEFTDRVEILRELDTWVKDIQRMASASTALISPRRMGKTVLLDRLVNTVFCKPEYRVAPFYFKMNREKTMMKFNRETLDAALFGKSGKLEMPLFQVVDTKTVKGSKTKPYQIDVHGREQGQDRVWLCECKYTKTAMGISQVKKLEQAAEAFRQAEREAGRPIPAIRLWLVSTGGFTPDVVQYVAGRDDMYASDYDGINGIFQRYGGNYRIPIFESRG